MKNLCPPRPTKKANWRLSVAITIFSLLLLSLSATAFMQSKRIASRHLRPDAPAGRTKVSIPINLVPVSQLSPDACTQVIQDSTFEAGDPWTAWTTQTSTQFGTPMCDTSFCNENEGDTSPFSGTNWAWFGGTGGTGPESATLGQSVTIAAGSTATLKYQMKIDGVTPFTDVLTVKVDGTTVQTFNEPATDDANYILRTVDISAFANGAAHTILFSYVSTNDGASNYLVDDVTLDVCTAGVVVPPGQKFTSSLNPGQEVPAPTPLATLTGSGIGLVRLNLAENQISVALSYTGLGSNAIAGHIHGSATSVPGQTAPIIFDLAPSGGTSGTNTATTFAITPAQVALLRAGLMYFNVHTTNNPSGEIRGQIHINDDPNNFDADGKVDTSVVRPNSPSAGLRTWFTQASSNGAVTSQQWGLNTDTAVPGDYDGDAKTDPAVYRNGTWFYLRSSDGTTGSASWGNASDIPVPGDYDKDGRTDLAVFRPSDGNWYILNSSNNASSGPHWGTNGDRPVPADYDRDGRTDLAVARNNDPGAGSVTWYILNSSNGSVTVQQWGLNSDNLVPADYDGDGKADIAVRRPSDNTWYAIRSSNATIITQPWGSSGDVAVPGDYDSDAKTDVAVFRPSEGRWYILRSLNNTLQTNFWGTNGDIPVPSIYVR